MADKTLPPEGLSEEAKAQQRSERRAFLRRAVGVGLPVVLATVKGRSVLAQETTESGSGCLSADPSGWLHRDGDNIYTQRRDLCFSRGYIDENGNPGPVEPGTIPAAEPVP
jgi:hypothetical protein